MKKDYVMGNSAIALGALSAGVKVVCGYPGTPSTEIIETIFRVPIEDSSEVDGVLLLLNTMGGDVEAGLAIAEMVASLSKPTVSLVLGGSHSIGVPIAVSTDYSFIVPTGTMVVHPVRTNGMVIGAPQTFNYFRDVQNRITGFVCSHCNISKERYEELMMETEILTKDVGSVLEGAEAVKEGIICEIGGISQAVSKLHQLISLQKKTE